MAKIRPLFWFPDPIDIELADDWKVRMIADQPKALRLDAEVFERLRWELYAFTGAQHIASFSADRKAVLIELDSLDSCAARLHGAFVGNRRTAIEKYRNKMTGKLTYPTFPKFGHQETESAKGHRIALDYVTH
jgi:hypothetical protein